MLVFHKQKIVLLALPKTGTTALETALLPHASAAILDPPGQKHVSARQYKNRLSKFFEQRGSHPMQMAAVMREPIDWLGSWFRYRSRENLRGRANSTYGMSFDAFVTAWLEPKRPAFAEVGSQAKFLCDENGKVMVEHLYRYDQMPDFIEFFEQRLGEPLNLEQRNVSPKFDISLSPDIESRLRETAAEEFVLWDGLTGR